MEVEDGRDGEKRTTKGKGEALGACIRPLSPRDVTAALPEEE